MYENIGSKIQMLGKVIGWICLIGGAIGFLATLANEQDIEIVIIPLIIGVVGYLSSWFMIGFGQLVDDIRAIASKVYDEKK